MKTAKGSEKEEEEEEVFFSIIGVYPSAPRGKCWRRSVFCICSPFFSVIILMMNVIKLSLQLDEAERTAICKR
jgi:hypothetical protein